MSARIKMMLRDAERAQELGFPSLNRHVLDMIAVLSEEIDASARGLATLTEQVSAHVHLPHPLPAARIPLLIDAGRAIALADAVRAFLVEERRALDLQRDPTTLAGALRLALEKFESGK